MTEEAGKCKKKNVGSALGCLGHLQFNHDEDLHHIISTCL